MFLKNTITLQSSFALKVEEQLFITFHENILIQISLLKHFSSLINKKIIFKIHV